MTGERDVEVSPARGWWVLPVVIIGAIVLFGLIGVAIDDPAETVATSPVTSSSSSTSTTILFTTQTTEPFETITTTAQATTTTGATATTIAAAPCRNSTNASCGAFSWSPQPGANRPISIEVAWDVTSP